MIQHCEVVFSLPIQHFFSPECKHTSSYSHAPKGLIDINNNIVILLYDILYVAETIYIDLLINFSSLDKKNLNHDRQLHALFIALVLARIYLLRYSLHSVWNHWVMSSGHYLAMAFDHFFFVPCRKDYPSSISPSVCPSVRLQ